MSHSERPCIIRRRNGSSDASSCCPTVRRHRGAAPLDDRVSLIANSGLGGRAARHDNDGVLEHGRGGELGEDGGPAEARGDEDGDADRESASDECRDDDTPEATRAEPTTAVTPAGGATRATRRRVQRSPAQASRKATGRDRVGTDPTEQGIGRCGPDRTWEVGAARE